MNNPTLNWKQSIQHALSKVGYALGLGLMRNTPTLRQEIERRAVASSADYVERQMSDAVMFLSHRELVDFTVARAPASGMVLEFGVYKAQTLNYIAGLVLKRFPHTTVWGFDSFEGLPEDWAGYIITKETFDLQGRMPAVQPNVKLVKGFFDESIDPWRASNAGHVGPISILHIDSDLYQSCAVILEKLREYIQVGTFILFDEYFNYPNWQQHEYRAFSEFCERYKLKYRYRGFCEQKVLVEMLA